MTSEARKDEVMTNEDKVIIFFRNLNSVFNDPEAAYIALHQARELFDLGRQQGAAERDEFWKNEIGRAVASQREKDADHVESVIEKVVKKCGNQVGLEILMDLNWHKSLDENHARTQDHIPDAGKMEVRGAAETMEAYKDRTAKRQEEKDDAGL